MNAATAASKMAPPPIRKQIVVKLVQRDALKNCKPQCSQAGAEKLLRVLQLGHCLIRTPLQRAAGGSRIGLDSCQLT
jgi:hypothetical protein